MQKTYIVTFILICVSLAGYSQQTFTSNDNTTAAWTDYIWSKSQSWMQDRPRFAGNNSYSADYGYWHQALIYGYITRYGDFTVDGGGALHVFDTLRIAGDLTSRQTIQVHTGGILIVEGNVVTDDGGVNTVGGNVVVLGDMTASNGADVDVNPSGNFYLLGSLSSPSSGEAYNGNSTPPTGYFQDEEDLKKNASLYAFATGGTLPVEFTYITANIKNEIVKISWATASEINNDFFTIERSKDGISYETVKIVRGAGNSHNEIVYNTTDSNPYFGTSFYRVKQTDFDGKFAYSDLVSVTNQIARNVELNIFPNPANNQVSIDLRNNMSNAIISISDDKGNLVFNTHSFDNSERITVDVSSFPKGIYLVKMQGETGQLIKKLIVK